MKRSCSVPVALLLLAAHSAALAQVATGNIRGTVIDASEAIIAGAKVTLVNANTGLRRTVATNEKGDFSAGDFTANRPDLVLGQPVLVANPGFDQYFNPKAFAIPPKVPDFRGSPIQTYGNLGRSVLRGPGSRNMDLSLFKEFRTTEKTRLQFRAEAFNLSNTPTFQLASAVSPALTVGNSAFGKLTGSQTVGQIQFGLKLLW
jgi:hypothetical protein